MQTFHYNRQTNTKVYYFGVLTIPDMFIGLIASILCFCLFKMVSLMLLYMILHLTYLGVFRAGKPAGHDVHFFSSFWTPKILRPGKRSPLYPVKTSTPNLHA